MVLISEGSANSVGHHCGRFKLLISHLAFAAVCNVGLVLWLMPTNRPIECPPCYDRDQSDVFHRKSNIVRNDLLSRKTETARSYTSTTANRNVTRNMMPSTLDKLFVGMGLVNRDDFARTFDVGVPLMSSSPGNEDVLILYGGSSSLPWNTSPNVASNAGSQPVVVSIPRMSSAHEATKNCITMKHIMISPEEPDTCLAVMGQWPSYYVHKWMRLPKSLPPGRVRLWNQPLASLQYPLRSTSRSHTKTNTYFRHFDKRIPEAFTFIANYFYQLDDTLQALRPIAQSMMMMTTTDSLPHNNTIVVMVCNHGQSELFLNFVCSARSRGLDLSQVLLFATDIEMKELGDALGISTFYNDKIFGELPKSAAGRFFDTTFARMVLAKVCCVHLVNLLGYNVLLQDVDVIWYRHPLEFFSSFEITHDGFDMYFQDNGSRSKDYESFYANTGFYFVRYNARTVYYFSVLVRQADLILAHGDDQLVMNVLLNEHASLTGLRVKTIHRDDTRFPGGFHYQSRPEQMKKLLQAKIQPYVFHTT